MNGKEKFCEYIQCKWKWGKGNQALLFATMKQCGKQTNKKVPNRRVSLILSEPFVDQINIFLNILNYIP